MDFQLELKQKRNFFFLKNLVEPQGDGMPEYGQKVFNREENQHKTLLRFGVSGNSLGGFRANYCAHSDLMNSQEAST